MWPLGRPLGCVCVTGSWGTAVAIVVIVIVVFLARLCSGRRSAGLCRYTQGCTPCPSPGHSACCHACFCCPHLAPCSGPGHGSRLSELTLAPAACGIVTVPGSFWVAITASLCLPAGCRGAACAASSVSPTSLSCPTLKEQDEGALPPGVSTVDSRAHEQLRRASPSPK